MHGQIIKENLFREFQKERGAFLSILISAHVSTTAEMWNGMQISNLNSLFFSRRLTFTEKMSLARLHKDKIKRMTHLHISVNATLFVRREIWVLVYWNQFPARNYSRDE